MLIQQYRVFKKFNNLKYPYLSKKAQFSWSKIHIRAGIHKCLLVKQFLQMTPILTNYKRKSVSNVLNTFWGVSSVLLASDWQMFSSGQKYYAVFSGRFGLSKNPEKEVRSARVKRSSWTRNWFSPPHSPIWTFAVQLLSYWSFVVRSGTILLKIMSEG